MYTGELSSVDDLEFSNRITLRWTRKFGGNDMKKLLLVGMVVVVALALIAGRSDSQGPPEEKTTREFEEIIFIDMGVPFHGGPPPHNATDAAKNFRLTMGGISWAGNPTVKYEISKVGCASDCSDVLAEVNSGLDTWELTGVTFTQDDVSPDTNPCTESGNIVSWEPLDGAGDILAVAAVCRNVATKEIAGFRVIFDSDDDWSDSGGLDKFDIQATMAHEGGHVIGLGHVNPPKASRLTMFLFIAEGDIGAQTLGCGDRRGVNAAYGTTLNCDVLPGD